ncbi:MAG: winged helix-turn-helix domain-containing protein [Solirubrobacteraceae bacterium]
MAAGMIAIGVARDSGSAVVEAIAIPMAVLVMAGLTARTIPAVRRRVQVHHTTHPGARGAAAIFALIVLVDGAIVATAASLAAAARPRSGHDRHRRGSSRDRWATCESVSGRAHAGQSPAASERRTAGGEPEPMSTARFDELIHAPTRLAIVSLLAAAQGADFKYIRDELGLSDSALSKQLSTLESAGYIEIRRAFIGKHPRTSASLSRAGRRAFDQHVAALLQVTSAARQDADPRPAVQAARQILGRWAARPSPAATSSPTLVITKRAAQAVCGGPRRRGTGRPWCAAAQLPRCGCAR